MASTSPNLSEFRSSNYATSDSGSTYHLLYLDNKHTLCGFKVESSESGTAAKPELHVVDSAPSDRKLCIHCGEMDQRRAKASMESTAE